MKSRNQPKKKNFTICFCILFTISGLSGLYSANKVIEKGNAANQLLRREKAQELVKEGYRHLANGLSGEARSSFLEAVKADESFYKPYLELGLLYRWEEIDNLAIPYLEKARSLISQAALGESQNSAQVRSDRMRAERLLAGAYLNENRLENSGSLLEKLSLEYNDAGDFGQLAWVMFKENQLHKAKLYAQKGISINALDLPSRNTMAVVLSHEKKFQEALNHYQALSARDQESPVILNNVGETLVALFRYQEASIKFLEAIVRQKNYDTALTHINLAQLYLDRLLVTPALDILKGYTGHRDWGFYLLTMVRGYYMKGDIREASRLLAESEELRQTYGHIGWGKDNFDYLHSVWASRIYYAQYLGMAAAEKYSLLDDIRLFIKKWQAGFLSWWHRGKAARIISRNTRFQEDLFIHSSDNSFDYPEMDTLLAQFPYLAMKKKLLHLLETDSRQEAAPFYLAWLANLEWENGNKVYGNIYHYRSLEKMDREKYPLLYLSLLRQKASFAGDMNAGLMIYSILPAYAFYAGIRLPVELSLDSKVGQKSELLLKMQRVWQEYNAGISRGIISPFFYKAGNEEQAFKIFINLKEESHTQKNSTTFRINIEDEIFDRKLDYEMILPGTDEKRLVQAILYRIGLELFGIKFPDF